MFKKKKTIPKDVRKVKESILAAKSKSGKKKRKIRRYFG